MLEGLKILCRGIGLSLLLNSCSLSAYAAAEPHFTRIDFTAPLPVVEWNQQEAPGTLEVLDHLQRGTAHYVGVEWWPTDHAELSQAYVLVCDAAGQVLRSLPLDERFDGWQFLDLPGDAPRQAVVVNGGGRAHIYRGLWIYALGEDHVPGDLLFETRAVWVVIEDSKAGLRVIRSLDNMVGGHSSATNVHRWDGQHFQFDAQRSTWPEEPPDTRRVWER